MASAAEPTYRVPATALFHVVTAGLMIGGLLVLSWGLREGSLFLAGAAGVLLLVALARLRSRVVVSPSAVRVTGELFRSSIELDDIDRVDTVRDGVGWTTRIVRRDGSTCRVLVLSSFSQENTRLAADELSFAIDEMRALRDAASDEAG
jgi:hypothetical protein